MRHRIFGRRLNRTSSHRRALRRNLAASLIQHGAIRTTEAKAKELRPFIERLITVAKQGTLHARRRVISTLGRDRDVFDDDGGLQDKSVVQMLFDEIAPRYADRPGGYTRIIRLGDRRIGDAGVQVLLQLVEEETPGVADAPEAVSRRRRRAARRLEAAGIAEGEPVVDQVDEPDADEEAVDADAPVDQTAGGDSQTAESQVDAESKEADEDDKA